MENSDMRAYALYMKGFGFDPNSDIADKLS